MTDGNISSCSIVIPVFNNQKSLDKLVQELVTVLKRDVKDYEILFVNDGSQDQSWTVIEDISHRFEYIHAFDLSRNFGQHNALLCGIRAAEKDVIITMDDDMQHPPSEIKTMLRKLAQGYDLIYGSPKREKHGIFRNFSSRLIKWAINISMRIKYAEKISAFRAFRTSLRDQFVNNHSPYVSIDVLLSRATSKIGFIEIAFRNREYGESQYSFYKLLKHTSNLVLGFSVLPLRIASILGFIFTVIGCLLLVYVLIRYFVEGVAIPGFAFLASTFVTFSGIQLFVLGIIGEYLAIMFTILTRQPQYIISRSI